MEERKDLFFKSVLYSVCSLTFSNDVSNSHGIEGCEMSFQLEDHSASNKGMQHFSSVSQRIRAVISPTSPQVYIKLSGCAAGPGLAVVFLYRRAVRTLCFSPSIQRDAG